MARIVADAEARVLRREAQFAAVAVPFARPGLGQAS
jgi:hypothetical protein